MFILVALSCLALASASAAGGYQLHHHSLLPAGWKRLKNALPDEVLDLSLELQQPRMAALKERLDTISDPNHADYGHHLTKEDLRKYQVPDQYGAQMILSWLNEGSVHDAVIKGSSIHFSSSAATINRLFGTSIGHYAFDNAIYLRAMSYSIPSHLGTHIRFLHPLSHFAKPIASRRRRAIKREDHHRRRPASTGLTDMVRRDTSYTSYKHPHQWNSGIQQQPCPDQVNPHCLRKLLGLPAIRNQSARCHAPQAPKVRYAVAGFLEQYAHHNDISSFLQRFAPEVQSASGGSYNFTVQLLNNADNPQGPPDTAGPEASLDLEYALALGYPSEITYYLSGGRAAVVDDNGTEVNSPTSSRNEPFLELLQDLLSLEDDAIPHVLSISYSDDENTVPPAYAAKVCDQFAQLAARGTTVLVSSGDGGAGGTSSDSDRGNNCYSNDGRGREMFIPTFPPSCPYVTAVGATGATLPLQGSMASGGGFSDYFARPAWQQRAAAEYLSALRGNGTIDMRFYNASGRAIPDLSAPGEAFSVVVGGEEDSVGGTSASVVVVAAMIALIDEQRLKRGKSGLGWLNPLLYSQQFRHSHALVDVSMGSNLGCTYGNVTVPGFAAYKGYDCVTGLGSVGNFKRFLRALV
ncbi:subtilisin-like protein [Apiospora arundinis]